MNLGRLNEMNKVYMNVLESDYDRKFRVKIEDTKGQVRTKWICLKPGEKVSKLLTDRTVKSVTILDQKIRTLYKFVNVQNEENDVYNLFINAWTLMEAERIVLHYFGVSSRSELIDKGYSINKLGVICPISKQK